MHPRLPLSPLRARPFRPDVNTVASVRRPSPRGLAATIARPGPSSPKTRTFVVKGFRTLGLSAALAALGAIEQADLATIVPSGYEGLALTLVGALMAGLRIATTTPAGRRPRA